MGVLLDAGILIAAILRDDSRHDEAHLVVEQARRGELNAATTPAILSEAYAALTWSGAQPAHSPSEAERVVRALVAEPSRLGVLPLNREVALRALALAASHGLTARRVHDARHAAAALEAGLTEVYTYDVEDWRSFEADGLTITGPPSIVARLEDTDKTRKPS